MYGGKLLETTYTWRTLPDSDINTNALWAHVHCVKKRRVNFYTLTYWIK